MSLQYSDFEPIQQNKEITKSRNKNQTLKNRRREKSIKVQKFLDAIDNDDNSGLHDFRNTQVKANNYKDFNPKFDGDYTKENVVNDDGDNQENEEGDNHITKENFDNLQSNYANEYYKQYIPYYNQVANSQDVTGQKELLLEKLNYMIHLLEEQQEEKTGHITEELILYTFLGVFVIFVVDSFARAGKYVR